MNYVMDTTWFGTVGAMIVVVVIASSVFGCARRWRTARGVTTLANPGLARADHRSPLSRCSLQAAKFDSSFGTAREAWIDLRQSLWDSVSDDV
jgi:hypothetical protein